MFEIKQIIFVILLLALTGGLVRFCAPEKIVYQTSEQSEKLDSLTTLNRNLVVTRDQLEDSLEHTTEAFQKFVSDNRDEIASYNRIIGQLNLQVDSLENRGSSVSLADLQMRIEERPNVFKDTTLTASSSFGNGLLRSEAKGGIRNDSLFVDPPTITQLRPVRIDHAVSVSDDRSSVISVTTSRDFSDLRVESVTEIRPEKKFPWTALASIASFLLGYLL